MASILKVGEKWRALIRRKGHPVYCKTFRVKTQAEAWARSVEGDIDCGKPVQNALEIAAIPKWVEHQIIQTLQPFPAHAKQVGSGVNHLYRERIEQPGFRLKVCGPDLSNQAGYLRAVNVVRIEHVQKTFCQVAGQGVRS